MQETWVRSQGQEDPLEEGMATHSRILAWKSHGQRSLVGYSPRGHKRVGHDLATKQQHYHVTILKLNVCLGPNSLRAFRTHYIIYY